MVRIVPLVLLFTFSFLGCQNTNPEHPPTTVILECHWTEVPIVIDGRADESAWQKTPAIALGKAGRVKLLWDRTNLYYYAELDDEDVAASVKEHDGDVTSDDSFGFFLKPAVKEPGYYEFHLNALGTLFDCFHPKEDRKQREHQKTIGEFHNETKVVVKGTINQPNDKDKGWTAEGRIPWTDFLRAGGRPNPQDTWQVLLTHADRSSIGKVVTVSTTPQVEVKDTHNSSLYAKLKFLGPPAPAPLPPVPSKVIGTPEPPLPYKVKRVYPKFSPEWPIQVRAVPGTDQMLFITEAGPYGPTQLYQVKDDPAITTADAVKVMDTPLGGVAYDIAFHPNFAQNGYVYIGWNAKIPDKQKHHTRISRYTMTRKAPYTLDPKSEFTIVEWESHGHNGGAVCFGADGKMYVTSGDGTADSDLNLMGQRTDVLLCKVLRIDVDRPTKDKPYSVPADNPFIADKSFAPETWAYGLRNPWRISSDNKSGQIWVGNNGQDIWETAQLIRKGENYGWSIQEGSHAFYPNRTAGPTPITNPTVEHHHAEFRSLTGGLVIRQPALPGLNGAYTYGDYSTGRIWAVKHDGTKIEWHKELATSRLQITAFSTNTKGELLICDHHGNGEGGFYTLELAPPVATTATFPKTLSETGLFTTVKNHVLHPGVLPYEVAVPFWSDGLTKTRAVYLPPGGKVGYTGTGGWNFPDETVLVKSFSTAPGKYVETRLMTKQNGEWLGYSYKWNPAGTDADLVPARGADEEITLDGKQQVWHYPSRTECMVCHSRAANFTLGLCEVQMNKRLSTTQENQISNWERRGLFATDWAEEARGVIAARATAKGLTDKEADAYRSIHGQQPGQQAAKPSVFLNSMPDKRKTLVDPTDLKQPLELRAKAWLHTNCSMCHVENGGGNARMDLDYSTPLKGMRILDIPPMHATLDLKVAKLLAPGAPERSVLLKRIRTRGPGQMPPLSSNKIDEAGVKLIEEWIRSLKP